jgi:hypothetical protein
MRRLAGVMLGVVLGLGVALTVGPWISSAVHARRAERPVMVGGF